MYKLFLNFFLLALFAGCAVPEVKVPVIHSTVPVIDIKDGNNLIKGNWSIDPAVRPDVFETFADKVTFYTDLDSISFKINPKMEKIDFMIVLNETDTAHTQIRYKEPYLSVLKKARAYDRKDMRYVPEFTYQSENDSSLVKLRKHYKLDSIAGAGNEVDQIINLMYWVHNTVKHDGNNTNPNSKNAFDIIDLCQKEDRGVNCRMMAIILNECYLAMGIPSRYVTCMPKPEKFKECHVINLVFASELQKWIWIDPTFAAYVKDENGELLSIAEVRERLIEHKPLVLNPDANWNHQSPQTKEYYLENYMAKNLYRIKATVASRFNAETWGETKKYESIELLPLDGLMQSPQKDVFTNSENGVTFINYKTNNPDLFWALPETIDLALVE